VAQHRSAEKRHRQNQKRRSRNRANLSQVRTHIKKFRTALETGDKEAAQKLLPTTLGQIDKAARKGAIHDNTASRTKGRLQKHLNQLLSA
jgi:small subunit ribosomal protein S20